MHAVFMQLTLGQLLPCFLKRISPFFFFCTKFSVASFHLHQSYNKEGFLILGLQAYAQQQFLLHAPSCLHTSDTTLQRGCGKSSYIQCFLHCSSDENGHKPPKIQYKKHRSVEEKFSKMSSTGNAIIPVATACILYCSQPL